MSRYFLTLLFAAVFLMAGRMTCLATTVGLQWDAVADPTVVGYKVYYQADSSAQPFTGTGAVQGAAPIDAYSQTTATISGLDPAHAYYFGVTAYYATGLESPYSNIVYVPELVSPTIYLVSPVNKTSVSGTVAVTADASDNSGVSRVEFYLNGVLTAADTGTPYVYSWDTSKVAAGSYLLMAKAYDAAGNVSQSSIVTVTVVNDTTQPAVTVTSPANNATVGGTLAITASASDNVGVNLVEFYINGAMVFATNVAPYSYTWNTTAVANGSYTLTARAYDASNNSGQSGNVTVTVSPTAAASLVVATAALPGGAAGFFYSQPLSAFGGRLPYSWDIIAGALPAGLTFGAASGTISGVPTATGVFPLSVRVTDANGSVATKSISLAVASQACSNSPARLSGVTTVLYPDFAPAYAAAPNDSAIQLQALDFGGDFILDRDVTVALLGGFNCGYTADADAATGLLGKLRVARGTVRVGSLRLK